MNSHQSRTALLFPGQGAYYAGALTGLEGRFPVIGSVLDEMAPATTSLLGLDLRAAVLDAPHRDLDEWLEEAPDALQLAILAVSIATYECLVAEGVRRDVLIGHSMGEIAALVCSGALTVAQGAQIACHRAIALREAKIPDSHMLALSTDAIRTQLMLDLVGDPNAGVAVENYDAQTVISGPTGALDTVTGIAHTLRLSTRRLKSPYPFHNPMLADAAADFLQRIRSIIPGSMRIPVVSPILGRAYGDGDDLIASLASHLVQQVHFHAVLRTLPVQGITTLVECGPLDALTRIASRVLPDACVVAPLPGTGDENVTWDAAMLRLAEVNALQPANDVPVTALMRLLLPDVPADQALQFWSAHQQDVRRSVRSTFDACAASGVVVPVQAPAPESQPASPAVQIRDRATLLTEIAAIYATALEYPVEVFAADTDLESELGVDSVKQTELLARVSETYALPAQPADFRLADYGTLGLIVDLVLAQQPTELPAAVAPAQHDRVALLSELATIYAAALEYPVEVFAADTDLEAELGVDSVKQTELLARVSETYALPQQPADFRLADHGTLGRVVDLVLANSGTRLLKTA